MSSCLCVHKITQWLPSYCLHVKRVERLCYVHNIDTLSKVSKEALTVLFVTHITHVERVKSGVCGFYAVLYTE